MENVNDLPPTIANVLVIPKSPSRCRYWLNDSKDIHVKKREDLLEYLSELAPTLRRELSMLLNDYYKSFILVVSPPQIIELKRNSNMESSHSRISEKLRKREGTILVDHDKTRSLMNPERKSYIGEYQKELHTRLNRKTVDFSNGWR